MSNAHLYVAVREAAAGTFDVLGELGSAAHGGVVYLARELAGDALVVLKLEPGDGAADNQQYFLDVARELDASVPDVELHCPRCRAKLRQWARFCTQCGLDVSGEAPASGEHASRAALREKVRAATTGQYEFLGDIPRAEGGGLVYFARDLSDGKIVALRLQKDLNQKLAVGVTRTLKAVERERHASGGGAAGPAVTIVQRGVTPRPRAVAPHAARGAPANGFPGSGRVADAARVRPSGERAWWARRPVAVAAILIVALILYLVLAAL